MVAAAVALLSSYLASWDLYLTGFSDDHLTDYDKAADVPKQVIRWTELGFGPLFLALAFSRSASASGPSDCWSSLTVLHWRKKTSGMARDTATDSRPAFVVDDRAYLSARWPGDTHTLAKVLSQKL